MQISSAERPLKALLGQKNMEDLDGDAVGKIRTFVSCALIKVESFDRWSSLVKADDKAWISIKQMHDFVVAKFKSDSLLKAAVQHDDKNSDRNVLLVNDQMRFETFTLYNKWRRVVIM
uniref:Uncharacterized protein n=1 Tax=Onchocerca volvulus TaxID=6282 RepID=A0A8R1XV05_ONCVO